MAIGSAQAVRLLAELLEMDYVARQRRRSSSLVQKQRRAAIVRELQVWALARQQGPQGTTLREHPRAAVKLRVELIGGPGPVALESDSLAVGGISVSISFQPKAGDLLPLRLVPTQPEEPVAVTGEVIWYDPFRGRAGLRFLELSEDARALIERLVFADLIRP